MALLTPRGIRVATARPALALLVALAAGLAGCGERDRANPLDPRNPSTSGSPTGFKAVALSGQVLLSWNASPGLGTQIFRRAESEPSFVAISDELPSRNTLFIDALAPNGVTYHYRLHFVTAQGLAGLPATAEATPSPVVAWTADETRGSLLRLSADGREVASEQPGFGKPVHLAVDRARDLVWVADDDRGWVWIYVASIGVPVRVEGFQRPGRIAIDPADGSAWISDWFAGTVRHVLSSGGPGTPSQVPVALDEPLDLGVDAQTGALWVCEYRGGRVRRFAANGTTLGSATLTLPSRVAVDSANGEGWVTSFETGRLLHFGADLSTLHTITSVQAPLGVAVDPRRGRIWVADPIADQVIAFRRDGSEELRVGGLTDAADVAVELATGEAWVTLRDAVARVAVDGTRIATSRGLTAPVAVGLDRLAN